MLGALESSDSYLDPLSHILPATGGSAMKAVEVLVEHGVPEERIIFINLVSESPLHLEAFRST
jgi:uracil phosphoribosyltransferase